MLNRLIRFLLPAALSLTTACSSISDTEIMDRLQVLEAKEQIRALFSAYGRTLDERDYGAFASLYAEDAEYIGGGTNTPVIGAQSIADSLDAIISANASGANLHVFSNEVITVHAGGESASAISRGAFYVQDESGNPTPLMFATYHDELILKNGRWLFSRRQVIGDIPGPSNESRAQNADN